MIRSPFHFNTLSFTTLNDKNTAVHMAPYYGSMYGKEKKIDIDAKGQSAINLAKDDPKLVMLLMKHCKWDNWKHDIGPKTLATLKENYNGRIKKE